MQRKRRRLLRAAIPALLFLALACSSIAIDTYTSSPATLRTGETGTIELSLRAEKNYSAQRVELTIKGDKTILLKNCNGTYQDTFYILNV